MRYIWLLKSVNLGKQNKVNMTVLKNKVENLGFGNVRTYINSGNVFFDSEEEVSVIRNKLELILNDYDFNIPFCLIDKDTYLNEVNSLPAWWNEDFRRKDALFYIDEVDKGLLLSLVDDEIVHIGNTAVFIGLKNESDYKKSGYVKKLDKVLKNYTLRNSNTFNKIVEFL